LSYVEAWEKLLGNFACATEYALVALYLPENPIGFVKSREDLETVFLRNFTALEVVHLSSRRKTILFGKSKIQ